jgi:hypothetical protein
MVRNLFLEENILNHSWSKTKIEKNIFKIFESLKMSKRGFWLIFLRKNLIVFLKIIFCSNTTKKVPKLPTQFFMDVNTKYVPTIVNPSCTCKKGYRQSYMIIY